MTFVVKITVASQAVILLKSERQLRVLEVCMFAEERANYCRVRCASRRDAIRSVELLLVDT